MEKALLFVGRLNKKPELENYQLLIGTNFVGTEYNPSMDRKIFYEELSEEFSSRILASRIPLGVGIANGLMINEDNKVEKIGRLEEELVDQFSEVINKTLIQNINGIVIEAPKRKKTIKLLFIFRST